HPPDIVRGPYLQRGTPESVVVRWRTNRPSDSAVLLGTPGGEPHPYALSEVVTTEHEVEVPGLTPDTVYRYEVGDARHLHAGDQRGERFVTPPPVGTDAPTRIWALGDSGTANSSARAVADAYRALSGPLRTDLWLMLGDNAYVAGTDEEYQHAVFEM